VLSHWIVDFIAHRPDLPLWPGGESRPRPVALDPRHDRRRVGFFIAGLALYLRATRARPHRLDRALVAGRFPA
jgi:hypothetical protein